MREGSICSLQSTAKIRACTSQQILRRAVCMYHSVVQLIQAPDNVATFAMTASPSNVLKDTDLKASQDS